MIQVLEQLAGEVGIRGAMLVARDGFPIASSPMRGVDGDVVAAIASAVLQGVTGALTGLNMETNFNKLVMNTAHGRLVFIDTEVDTYIIAITDKSINIDTAILELQGAAQRIRRMSELSEVPDETAGS